MFCAPRASRASTSVTGVLVAWAVASSCGGRPDLMRSKSSGGGGGSISSGGGGATGGRAPGASCTTTSECPAPDGPCVYAACEDGRCAVVSAAAGALVAVDEPADCFDTVCDGAGSTVKVLDLRNVPAPGPCTTNACAADGRVSSLPLAAGAPCGTNVNARLCDGAGACVGCVEDKDCPETDICDPAHQCVPPSCTDGVQNGAESDVDCGGACARCPNGKGCASDADCAAGLCHPIDHVCGAPTCTDARKDGDETDVDCGGSCPPCRAIAECRVDADCQSRACYSGLPHRCLMDHCLDGHQDFDETARDCGGPTCAKCMDFDTCKQDSDCQSGHCPPEHGWCLTATCFDGVRDGSETDVDCGGGLCAACALGHQCGIDYDCATNACDFLSLTCVMDPCTDHRRENGETDIDCGGPLCGATCRAGQNCLQNADCAPGLTCNYWKECQ
jgi:hypothetical protein